MKVSILTPTYNRSSLLYSTLESLERQTQKNFEWIIIDDGSTDNTKEVVKTFLEKNVGFPIKYLRKENGGKHTALNLAADYVTGEIVVILDSDDFFLDDALETILMEWQLKDDDSIGCLSFPRVSNDKKLSYLAYFPSSRTISNHIDFRINQNIRGDCCEVFDSRFLKELGFPEFAGENFLSENVFWINLSEKTQTLYIRKKIYVTPEYREDGLTHSVRKLMIHSPRGVVLESKLMMNQKIIISMRLKNALKYWVFSRFARLPQKTIKNSRFILYMTYVPGLVLYFYYKRKYRKFT